jgi:HlyD family secretion protein
MSLFAYLKQRRKAILAIVVVLVAAGVFLFTRLNASAQEASVYETEPAALGELTAIVGASGTVRANQSVSLVWKTSGTVAQVNYQVRDQVKAGDVLAILDATSLPQSVILAQADLVSAKKALEDLLSSDTDLAQAAINLRQAQEDYDDAREYRQSLNERVTYEIVKIVVQQTPLGPRKVPRITTVKYYPDEDEKAIADEKLALAKAKLEDAQRTYDRLKDGPNPDDVAAAQARVNAAQAALDQAKIIAPFDGVITEAKPQVGDIVSAGQSAFRVDDLTRLLVDVDVSEVDINQVAVGQPATVTFDAVPGKTYHGRVTEVGVVGTTTNGAVNFSVTVMLNDADEQVRPGMTAAIEIEVVHLADTLLVPNRAVRVINGERVVYVLRDNQPVAVKIELGASSDSYSQVSSGDLKVGDLIILNPPAASLQPGPGNGGMRMFRP